MKPGRVARRARPGVTITRSAGLGLARGVADRVTRGDLSGAGRLPPEGGRHMLREVTDDRPIFVEPELVGDGQQQGVGFRERPVLTQLRDEGVGVGRVGSSEGGYRRVEVADLISGCAQAVQARVAPGEQGGGRAGYGLSLIHI